MPSMFTDHPPLPSRAPSTVVPLQTCNDSSGSPVEIVRERRGKPDFAPSTFARYCMLALHFAVFAVTQKLPTVLGEILQPWRS